MEIQKRTGQFFLRGWYFSLWKRLRNQDKNNMTSDDDIDSDIDDRSLMDITNCRVEPATYKIQGPEWTTWNHACVLPLNLFNMSFSDHLPLSSLLSLQMMVNFNIIDTLPSSPTSLICQILQMFLDNCFKAEFREKQTLLLTHLEVLFDFSTMVKSRIQDKPTIIPLVTRFWID